MQLTYEETLLKIKHMKATELRATLMILAKDENVPYDSLMAALAGKVDS